MPEAAIDLRTLAQRHRDSLKRDLLDCNSSIADIEEDIKRSQAQLKDYQDLRTLLIEALSTPAAQAIPEAQSGTDGHHA